VILKSFEELALHYFQCGAADLSVYQRPTTSDFSKVIPLSPSKEGKVRILRVKLTSKPDEALKALLWEVFFGKHLRVWHWFVLFDFLWRQKTASKFAAVLKVVLELVTPKGGPQSYTSNLRNVNATLKLYFSSKDAKSKIDALLKGLPFDLPKVNPILSDYIHAGSDVETLRKPDKPRRIGVGYKDHGSLGNPGLFYDPCEIDVGAIHGRKSVWDSVLEIQRNLYPWTLNPLPKKRDNASKLGTHPHCVAPTSGPDEDPVVRIETRKPDIKCPFKTKVNHETFFDPVFKEFRRRTLNATNGRLISID